MGEQSPLLLLSQRIVIRFCFHLNGNKFSARPETVQGKMMPCKISKGGMQKQLLSLCCSVNRSRRLLSFLHLLSPIWEIQHGTA
jgi:hypothetical protein